MTVVEQQLLRQWRSLQPEDQKAAAEFVEFLHSKAITKKPRRSLLGLFAASNVQVSEQDIADVRRELWDDFPREISA